MNKVIIFGEGNIQEVMLFYLKNDSPFEVVAFTANKSYISSDSYLGYPIVPFEDIEVLYPPKDFLMFIPIGYTKINKTREVKYKEAKKKGYRFITYISSRSCYYGTPVGENSIILENSVIQPFTCIGNNTILWTGSLVAHHSVIGDHCFIASHAVISGSVRIDDNCFLGANSTLRDNILIGKACVIGAGADVLKDLQDYQVIVPSRNIVLNKTSKELTRL